MKKISLKKYGISALLIVSLFSVQSCILEDDSLPTEGSIADETLPIAGIAYEMSEYSSRAFLMSGSASLSSTQFSWELPEGASFATIDGYTYTSTDELIYVEFDEFDTEYVVSLTSSDNNGETSSTTVSITATDQESIDPTSSFTTETTLGNYERIFDASSSTDNQGGIEWTFFDADGNQLYTNEDSDQEDYDEDLAVIFDVDPLGVQYTTTDDYIAVSFPVNSGVETEYSVVATAINLDGDTDEATEAITIEALGSPDPEISFISSEDYLTKTFTNETPDTDSVLWSLPEGATLSDGYSLSDEVIEVTFDSYETYSVTLEVTNIVSLSTSEAFDVDVLNPSTITTPVIYRGGFEPGECTNPADTSAFGTTRSDLGKEWWIADGVSDRVYLGDTLLDDGTTEADDTLTIIDTGIDDRCWFDCSTFNRLNITGNSRSGARAASFDPTRPLRVAVQTIDVTPGADYKITFWVNNASATVGAGLKCYIIDPSVDNNNDANVASNIISGIITTTTVAAYTEHTLEFSASEYDQVKLYFYPDDPTAATFYVDDVSIAID